MSTFTPPDLIAAGVKAQSSHINDLRNACVSAFADIPSSSELTGGIINYAVSTGSSNAYIVDLTNAPASYFDGLSVDFKANHANTGAATVNVNSLGVKSLRRQNGSALAAGDILENKIYSFRYNSTSGYMEMQQLAIGSMADVTTVGGIADDVTTVAGISSEVATVASNDANITTCAGAIDSITGAPAQAAAAEASAVSSAASATISLNASRFKNKLYNGGFNVWRRGTSFTSATTPANSDGTYLMDRWILLSDGNDAVDVTQESTVVPTGAKYSAKFDVETINKKFGIVQILTNDDSVEMIGDTVSLSLQARISSGATIGALRAAVISWQGTADSPTKDVVSAWGAVGENPTLAASWTYEGSGSLSLTTAFQTLEIENVSIDTASTKNVAVFIWSDDVTTTLGDFLYIGNVQLEKRSESTTFEVLPIAETVSLCEYFYRIVRVGFRLYNASNPVSSRFTASFGKMRTTPTTTVTAVLETNLTDSAVTEIADNYIEMAATSIAVGAIYGKYNIALDAEIGV